MRKWRLCALLSVLATVLVPASTLGHGGGLAADGCHYDRSTGTRHCHRTRCGERISPPASAPQRCRTLDTRPQPPRDPDPPTTWRGLNIASERACPNLEVPYPWDDGSYPEVVKREIARRLGGVWSPYDRQTFLVLGDVDVDQIVSMTEAHASGLCRADAATQIAFYTDLSNLTLASPRVNRVEKQDRDAADWLPDSNRCWFAWRVLQVRLTYDLTIDADEAIALKAILGKCEPVEQVRPTPS